MVTILLGQGASDSIVSAQSAPVQAVAEHTKVKQSAARQYKRAETRLTQGRLDEAEQLVRKGLEQHPQSGVFRSGLLTEPYYPHFLLGLIHMQREQFEEAAREFVVEQEQGQILHDPELTSILTLQLARARQTDNQPPVVQSVQGDLVEAVFKGEGEFADMRFHGTLIDRGGVSALTIDGNPVEFLKSPGGYAFDTMLTVNAARTSVELSVADVTGNTTRHDVPLDIPALDLGGAADGVHALLIGVDHYADTPACPDRTDACGEDVVCYPLPDLGAAVRDAERFQDFLLRRGVPDENIQLLVSREANVDATRKKVLEALDGLKARRGDTVLFYFAGHGVNSADHKNLMLLSDTQPWECGGEAAEAASPLADTSIGVDAIEAALNEASFANRYVILDACRSPRSASTRGIGDDTKPAAGFQSRGFNVVPAASAAPDTGVPPVIFYATFDRSVSIEWTQKEAGYFTWYLLQGLRRDLSLWDLKSYVQDQVGQSTLQNHGISQKPHVDLPDSLENDYDRQKSTFILGNPAVVSPGTGE